MIKIKILLTTFMLLITAESLKSATVNLSQQARATVQKNLYLTQLAELDFGNINLVDQGGTFTIIPGESPRFTQTNNTVANGTAMTVSNARQARFVVVYKANIEATVDVVALGPLSLQGSSLGGGQVQSMGFTATVHANKLDFSKAERLPLYVGGTITIDNNQASGIYLGRYIIRIDY